MPTATVDGQDGTHTVRTVASANGQRERACAHRSHRLTYCGILTVWLSGLILPTDSRANGGLPHFAIRHFLCATVEPTAYR